MANSSLNMNTRTIVDYLCDCLPGVSLPEGAVLNVLIDRELRPELLAKKVDEDDRRLCKADLIVWLCTAPSSVGGTTDKDNAWEHTEKGFGLDASARAALLKQANKIYEELGEDDKMVVNKIHIQQHGIKVRNRYMPPRTLD